MDEVLAIPTFDGNRACPRANRTQEVVGSIPISSTSITNGPRKTYVLVGRFSVGRSPAKAFSRRAPAFVEGRRRLGSRVTGKNDPGRAVKNIDQNWTMWDLCRYNYPQGVMFARED